MDNKEIRKGNLTILIKENKTVAALGDRCDVSIVYLRQINNGVKDKNGTPRGMGDSVARKLEKGCGKPNGWMDVLHDNEGGEFVYIKNHQLAHLLKVAQDAPPEVVGEAIRGIATTTELIKAAQLPKPNGTK